MSWSFFPNLFFVVATAIFFRSLFEVIKAISSHALFVILQAGEGLSFLLHCVFFHKKKSKSFLSPFLVTGLLVKVSMNERIFIPQVPLETLFALKGNNACRQRIS